MASNQGSLYAAAAELLAAATTILAGTPAGAPTNRYVAHGPPAYDCCDSLIVNAGTLQYGSYTRGATLVPDPRMPVVPMIPLTITVLRCVNRQAMPEGGTAIRPAALTAIQADAQKVYADGWSLFCGINKMTRDGALFAGLPCRPFEIDGALPVSPDGGCLGWTLNVLVALDGFDPPGV